jgi:hypothetical protein
MSLGRGLKVQLIYPLITKNISNFHLVFYVYVANKAYFRMKRLSRLASGGSYRKHVVADGLQDYIAEGMPTCLLFSS